MYLVKTPLTAERAAALLVDTVRQLADVSNLHGITGLVKRTARELVGADGATFVLREGDQCHYVDEDAIGPLWKGQSFPMSACVSGWSMQYRQQAIIPDIYVDPRIPQDAYRPTFVKSLVMTPVRILQPWAAIGTYWASPFTPSAEEAGWLQMLADSTAIALENVRRQTEIDELKLDAAHQPLVKMCAWTRRVEYHGEWMSVEAYLMRRFDLKVTHAISPEGLKMMTPEFEALGEVA